MEAVGSNPASETMTSHSNRKLLSWQLVLVEAAAAIVAARPADFPVAATSANPPEVAMDVAQHVVLLANAMAALTIAGPTRKQQEAASGPVPAVPDGSAATPASG